MCKEQLTVEFKCYDRNLGSDDNKKNSDIGRVMNNSIL